MVIATTSPHDRRLPQGPTRATAVRPQRRLRRAVPADLSCPHRHPAVPGSRQRRQLRGRPTGHQGSQPLPVGLWTGVSAPLRGAVSPQPGRCARRDQQRQAFRRRLGPGARAAMDSARRRRPPASGSPSSAPDPPDSRRPSTAPMAGHSVTVFERQPKAGGMMRYGIPEYRLPEGNPGREIGVIESHGRPDRHDRQVVRHPPSARGSPEGLRRGLPRHRFLDGRPQCSSRARTPKGSGSASTISSEVTKGTDPSIGDASGRDRRRQHRYRLRPHRACARAPRDVKLRLPPHPRRDARRASRSRGGARRRRRHDLPGRPHHDRGGRRLQAPSLPQDGAGRAGPIGPTAPDPGRGQPSSRLTPTPSSARSGRAPTPSSSTTTCRVRLNKWGDVDIDGRTMQASEAQDLRRRRLRDRAVHRHPGRRRRTPRSSGHGPVRQSRICSR